MSETIVPKKGDKIYKEECVLCFKTAEHKIWCCVSCFEGFCDDHYNLHCQKIPSHNKFLIICKKVIIEPEAEGNQNKLAKLEIPAEKAPQYEYSYETEGPIELSQLNALIDATSCSNSNCKASSNDSSGWSEPSAQVCEHSLTLQQEPDISSSMTCAKCELKSNLWKCLTCGALSCGRRQFDGSGGNGHALEHYETCGHSLAIKLGTIAVKSDGIEADVYCYKCDDLVLDPELNSHLSVLGIDPKYERKTEKSTAELNLDINLTHTYAMTDASGSELLVLNGPWMKGFKNLGNSCYLASVIQSLRNLDKETFLASDHDYLKCPSSKATECLLCQLKKLYLGLSSEDDLLNLCPCMFKFIAAGNNGEFLSGRQQDASEFLVHLLEERFKRFPELSRLTKMFDIRLEEVITCGGCGNKRVTGHEENSLILSTPEGKDVCNLNELLEMRFSCEPVDWRCDGCNKLCEGTQKKTKIVSLPKYLVIVANRLKIKNWVPEKTECHIEGMDALINLEKYCGCREENVLAAVKSQVEADPVLLGELLMMGIEEEPARAALIACKNSSLDAAMTMIFEGIPVEPTKTVPAEGPSRESIDTLISAGFSEGQARRALESTDGDLERAFDWIFSHPECSEPEDPVAPSDSSSSVNYKLSSFITHKGSSVFCGHYVAHLKDEIQNRWILFNDEKVAEAVMDDSFPIKDAYIYIYKQE